VERARYSALAHATCPFAAPVHADTFTRLVDMLGLPAGAHVLDLGCGKAELSARIAERWGARVVGVERSPYALDAARARAAALSAGTPTLVEGDLADPPPGPWDLVVNIGAMPPGTQGAALRDWAARLTTGGRILVGDGYWRRPPDAGYLGALGAGADEMQDLDGMYTLAAEAGLSVVCAAVSPDADFEAYEVAYRDNALAWAAAHADDPDAPAAVARATGWWAIHERWGRDTLGFVVLLLAPVG
jgi:SAM-dependent methyltransferase